MEVEVNSDGIGRNARDMQAIGGNSICRWRSSVWTRRGENTYEYGRVSPVGMGERSVFFVGVCGSSTRSVAFRRGRRRKGWTNESDPESLATWARVGSFRADLGTAFSDKGRTNGREFTVTRELRGRAILPNRPATNGDGPHSAEDVEDGEGTRINVSHDFGLEFSAKRPSSDEPFTAP